MVNVERFDNLAFRISPAEASAMDVQQRVLLERGYEAVLSSGETRESLMGATFGIAVGICTTEHLSEAMAVESVFALTGGTLSVASGRLSYVLGLQGPCQSIETACSSSLVAGQCSFHALQYRESEAALFAGVNAMLLPVVHEMLAFAGMLSTNGRSHTFDNRANGYARAEGCSCVTIATKPTRHATSMRSSCVMQDGASASLTSPNGAVQTALLRAACSAAQCSSEEVTVREAHGTGTALGDPIEVGAVVALLKGGHRVEQEIALCGAKANFGHGEGAAGSNGMLSLLEMLQNATRHSNAQLRALNAILGGFVNGLEIAIPVHLGSGPSTCHGSVSSFGYSGTIALTILHHTPSSEPLVQQQRAHAPLAQRHTFSTGSASRAPAIMYTTCWVVVDRSSGGRQPDKSWPQILAITARPFNGGAPQHLSHRKQATDLRSRLKVLLMLGGDKSNTPSLSGVCAALSLVQQLVARETPPVIFLVTGGCVSAGPAHAFSDAAHGGVWGLARVVRSERPKLRLQSGDAAGGAAVEAAMLRLMDERSEAELVLDGALKSARLRPVAVAHSKEPDLDGVYAITGGLGGLGLRTAGLLLGHGASQVLLASRGNSVPVDSLGTMRSVLHKVVACDVADAVATGALYWFSGPRSLRGVLHAAGVLRDMLLRSMDAVAIRYVFAPKALGASGIHHIVSKAPLDVLGLFSSVASVFGTVGQINYAAANTYMEALAFRHRLTGTVGWCMQIPYVIGAVRLEDSQTRIML